MSGSSGHTQKIEDEVAKALTVLNTLTVDSSSGTGLHRESVPSASNRHGMPLNEIHFCQGMAFMFHKKIGLGISLERGSGFLIAKLPRIEHRRADQPVTWSAPLFFHVTGAGLGATIGYHDVQSVLLLDSQRSLESMTRPSFSMDANVGGVAGNKGASLEATTANLTAPSASFDTFSYTLAKGAMIDVSYKGLTLNADNGLNHGLYGAQATGKSILDGAHEPPQSPALKQLYARLDEIMSSSPEALLMFGSGAPGQAGQVHEMDGTPAQQWAHPQQAAAAPSAAQKLPGHGSGLM